MALKQRDGDDWTRRAAAAPDHTRRRRSRRLGRPVLLQPNGVRGIPVRRRRRQDRRQRHAAHDGRLARRADAVQARVVARLRQRRRRPRARLHARHAGALRRHLRVSADQVRRAAYSVPAQAGDDIEYSLFLEEASGEPKITRAVGRRTSSRRRRSTVPAEAKVEPGYASGLDPKLVRVRADFPDLPAGPLRITHCGKRVKPL